MRIQTFSIVAGSAACNARCPFCVSKMTVEHGVTLEEPEVDWRNFKKACQLAKTCGSTTAMLTSKGEPTLFPGQITRYLEEMAPFEFPFVELQSNGIPLIQKREKYSVHLKEWYDLGLTMIAISIVHFEAAKNHEIYLPYQDSYIDLPALIQLVHGHGISVRLACVMADGFIGDVDSLARLIAFAREHKVEQLSVRPVNHPGASRSDGTRSWAAGHALKPANKKAIEEYLEREGTRLMTLMHGAVVYDVGGQNVCLTDSLTIEARGEDLRQLIFFPDGHLRYDWQYEGAILL